MHRATATCTYAWRDPKQSPNQATGIRCFRMARECAGRNDRPGSTDIVVLLTTITDLGTVSTPTWSSVCLTSILSPAFRVRRRLMGDYRADLSLPSMTYSSIVHVAKPEQNRETRYARTTQILKLNRRDPSGFPVLLSVDPHLHLGLGALSRCR